MFRSDVCRNLHIYFNVCALKGQSTEKHVDQAINLEGLVIRKEEG
jgi:hypothetical protein